MHGVFAFIHGDCLSCGKGGGRCFKSLSRNHAVQTREPHAKGAKELGSCVQENKSPDGERNFGGCSRFSRIPLCALCVLCVRFLLHEWFAAVFAGIGAGVGALPGPRGASEGSRWEASTAGRGAPTGPPAGHGRAPAGRMNAPLAWQWFMRPAGAPGTGASPGGCALPPELPTGYPHARLQREASQALISRKTGGNRMNSVKRSEQRRL